LEWIDGESVLSAVSCELSAKGSKGLRAGIISSVTIGFAFFLFEIVEFNTTYFTYFPATIVVLAGWLLGVGITRIAKGKLPSTSSKGQDSAI